MKQTPFSLHSMCSNTFLIVFYVFKHLSHCIQCVQTPFSLHSTCSNTFLIAFYVFKHLSHCVQTPFSLHSMCWTVWYSPDFLFIFVSSWHPACIKYAKFDYSNWANKLCQTCLTCRAYNCICLGWNRFRDPSHRTAVENVDIFSNY